ncbi:polysaccharide biosynthesis tyrosine autokinase [Microbacterium sp. PRF11]|uniref:polysaccharide biosynthesis tyrosine autokinase n=1 Tax=Microbacterium sp. PRF11 TaxID=2962593 RepID=UPI002881B67F|nr:polysaccharide biosynthesis tyrosine autokinase [Microbacterium sp. PRF11]MDT0117727.1 polysaccharide biosynthesis tyrosine autokinase [Microbacterium sp. PRF11]
MELSDYVRILRKNWLVIVLTTLVGLGAATAYTFTRVPTYESSSTVFVSTQAGSTTAELQQGSVFAQARINTYVGLVQTPAVLNPVIGRLGLEETPEVLATHVTATASSNSTLITLTVTDTSASQAAAVANEVAASLATVVPQLEPAGADGNSTVRISRVRDAQPAVHAATPNIPLNLGLGLLVGFAIGIATAVLRTALDNRVRTPRDAENATGAPGIGSIAFDAKAKERPLIVHADPLSPRAESFRALRTNLQFLDMGGRSSFVVTSSVPSEGKSTTTINLAIALADAGKRVALVDADLRKPKVAEYLSIEGGAGLTDVLIGRAEVNDVMLPWGGRSLYVLPAGKIPPNPSELLGSHRMSELLARLEEQFDVVLCDAPPLLPVTDAAILGRATSGALMVIAAGRTTKRQLEAASEALKTVDAKVAGSVMSMVPTRGPDSYYASYGYGYTYRYGDPVANPRRAKKLKIRDADTRPVTSAESALDELGFKSRRTARETDSETF